MNDLLMAFFSWLNENPIVTEIGLYLAGAYVIYAIFKPLFTGKDPDDGGLPWLPF